MQNKTYIYVVNDSPWPISAELDLEAQGRCELQGLGNRAVQRPKWMGRQMTWDVDLEPYDVLAVVASSPVKVQTWRVTVDRNTYTRLRQRVMEFNACAMMLDRPDTLQVLANPSFEAAPDEAASIRLPGWVSAQGGGISVELDSQEHIDGKQSLKISSQGPVAWVRSDPFEPPKTGRIAVIVRLKTTDPNNQPPLQLSIDGLLRNGATYYKPFSVGRGVKVQPLAGDWGTKPFAMVISDLPIQELVNLRVGFDLMGQGDVWVDDVQVYDHWFPKNERDDLMIMRGLAARSLSMGQIADCERILSGYWPQFLAAYVSVTEPRVASVPEDIPLDNRAFPPPQPKTDDEKSSMLDKVKRHLPSKVFPFKMR